jgi:hypothetical protein
MDALQAVIDLLRKQSVNWTVKYVTSDISINGSITVQMYIDDKWITFGRTETEGEELIKIITKTLKDGVHD